MVGYVPPSASINKMVYFVLVSSFLLMKIEIYMYQICFFIFLLNLWSRLLEFC
jgi:hypothetical protein